MIAMTMPPLSPPSRSARGNAGAQASSTSRRDSSTSRRDGRAGLPAAALLARVFFVLALLILVGGALVWAVRRPVFDLRRITIAGALRHVNRAEMRTALAGHLVGNFFTLHLRDARDAFQSIPWVADASVRRVWPDGLLVRLTERRAVGTWSDGRLVSDAGVLFEGNPAEADLDGPQIAFSGPVQFAPEAVARIASFARACHALGTALAGIAVSDRGSWTLRTARGQIFDLGRDDPSGAVQRRLDRLVRSDPVVVARLGGAPAYVDARYDNGFAASGPITAAADAAPDHGDAADGSAADDSVTRQP